MQRAPARSSARDGRPTPLSGQSSSVSSERLRRRSRPEATIAGEMLKQTALDFVGKPTTGIAETKVPGDPGDVALAGHAEIPIKRNAIHGWVLSILLRYSHPYKTRP